MYSITQWSHYTFGYLLGVLLVWITIGGVGVELGLHRLFSHSMYECNKWTRRFIGLLGCMSLNGDPLFWASIHRGSHHRHTDTLLDVHSPIHGIWHSYIGWIIDKETYARIRISDAPKAILTDRWFIRMQRHYVLLVVSVFALIYVIDPMFFFLSWIPGIFLAFNQGPMTNVMCHDSRFGYTNYELVDSSRNVTWLSYLTFGLALHNNHHKFPGLTNFAVNNREIDLGYILSIVLRFKERRLQPN